MEKVLLGPHVYHNALLAPVVSEGHKSCNGLEEVVFVLHQVNLPVKVFKLLEHLNVAALHKSGSLDQVSSSREFIDQVSIPVGVINLNYFFRVSTIKELDLLLDLLFEQVCEDCVDLLVNLF